MEKVQGSMYRYLSWASFIATWLVMFAATCAPVLHAHPSDLSKTEKIHASLIFKFTELVSWPESTYTKDKLQTLICTDKGSRFNHFLEQMNTSRSQTSHVPTIKVSNEVSSPYCHITYLSEPTFDIIPASDTRVLISSSASSPHPMTTIRLYQENQSVKYELNLVKLNKMKVKLSAEMLKYARIKR